MQSNGSNFTEIDAQILNEEYDDTVAQTSVIESRTLFDPLTGAEYFYSIHRALWHYHYIKQILYPKHSKPLLHFLDG
jgi:hypothetical protein